MNKQTIIAWKIEQLVENTEAQPNEQMNAVIANDPALQQELKFIELLWQPTQEQQPSSRLDSQFYQMLSHAQAVQRNMDTQQKKQHKPKRNFLDDVRQWLTPKPVMQFAVLALVFVAGVNVNQSAAPLNQNNIAPNLANLEQEVSSLNSMLALSMLQKSSAAERLTGVSYSQRSQLQDPVLIDTLITMLAHDKSTPVRLAIINALSASNAFADAEQQLVILAANETNTLVQINLCQLILSRGSNHAKHQLKALLSEKPISKEVSDILEQTVNISSI